MYFVSFIQVVLSSPGRGIFTAAATSDEFNGASPGLAGNQSVQGLTLLPSVLTIFMVSLLRSRVSTGGVHASTGESDCSNAGNRLMSSAPMRSQSLGETGEDAYPVSAVLCCS